VPAAWAPAAAATDESSLLSPAWWGALPGPALHVVGPSVLAVRDHWDDGPQPALVEQVPPWRLGGLLREADDADRLASGLAGDDVEVAFARFAEPVEPSPWAHRVTEAARRTVVSAAAVLTPWDGVPVDVGVLVDPAYRGRGHGLEVASAATRFAVTEHGLARWRCPESDAASVALATRLGFEPVARLLVVTAS
jgi:GNAT superfamily N-acetyltransferase